MRFSPNRARRRSIFILGALACAGLFVGGALWNRARAQATDTFTEVAPGLTLRAVTRQTAQGPLRFWLVKAAPSQFDLGLELADRTDAQKKRNVRALAAQSGATVAVNGGFFAYGGAAVGAVKTGGVWQRLPWKSRTALAWSDAKDAQIGPLSGVCELGIVGADGKTTVAPAALNGFALPGTRNEIADGYAVLTPLFARKYTLRNGEVALRNGSLPIPSGDVDLMTGECVIARGSAARTVDLTRPPQFAYTVKVAPDWSRYPNILGAGPRLIENGEVRTTETAEEFRPDVLARGPRTCVGLDAERNWLLLVADGRSSASVGLTIPETAQLFKELGATEAMNLDGGSSTQLVVQGQLVNTPSGFDPANPTRPREVQVSNALTLSPAPDGGQLKP